MLVMPSELRYLKGVLEQRRKAEEGLKAVFKKNVPAEQDLDALGAAIDLAQGVGLDHPTHVMTDGSKGQTYVADAIEWKKQVTVLRTEAETQLRKVLVPHQRCFADRARLTRKKAKRKVFGGLADTAGRKRKVESVSDPHNIFFSRSTLM